MNTEQGNSVLERARLYGVNPQKIMIFNLSYSPTYIHISETALSVSPSNQHFVCIPPMLVHTYLAISALTGNRKHYPI